MDGPTRLEMVDLYMRLAGLISDTMHAVAVQHELTPMQALTLSQVGERTLPTKEIARFLRCDPSNVTGLVDQLERRGLVRRVTPPHDRRVRAVEATESGRVVEADLRRALAGSTRVFDRLSAADTAELRRILQILTGDNSGPESS